MGLFNIPLPRIPLLRRHARPAFTALCDGALLLSLALCILPARPWAGMLAAVATTLPAWLNLARERRAAPRLFVPDPLAPDFAAFSAAFLESAAAAAMEDGARQTWTLCPFRRADGAFVPYAIDFRPAKGEIAVGVEGEAAAVSKSATLFRPRLAVPILVRDAPVALSLSSAGTRHQVFVDAPRPLRLPWNRADGNWMRDDIAKLWPALALALFAAFPDSALFRPERLVLLALLLVLATLECARGGRARAE